MCVTKKNRKKILSGILAIVLVAGIIPAYQGQVVANALDSEVTGKVASEDEQTKAFNVLASENSWTKHHHGDVKSVDATDTIIKVGGTTYGSEFTGFMLTKVAIDELAKQFDTMSFKIEFSSDTEAIPKYVDIYSTQKGDFISGWTLEADNDADYYFENGATVTIDLKTLSTISTQDVALKFVFTGEGASAWTPFGADAYVTFLNITFSNNVAPEDVTNYKMTGTYPRHEGKVFAGWYEDAEFTRALGEEVSSGMAYAKFVNADVMDVKAQLTAGTTAQSDKTDIRFISTVDELDYREVGFIFDIEGKGTQLKKTTNKVYERLYVVTGDQTDDVLPTEFSDASRYFYAYTYKKVPDTNFETVFNVQPYWITLDGTTVYGEVIKKTIMDAFYSVANLEIATTTSDLLNYGYNTNEEAIRGLYEAGFRNIDLSMYSFTSSSEYMQENWKDAVLSLKAVADELGMKFVQAHSQGGNPLSTNEVDFIVEATIRSIEICEVLGIKNTVVHPGCRTGLTKEQWFKENKAFYERILPTAERCGVNVLCENSTSKNMGTMYFINTGADMREFIEYVDHPNFHGCWDTGHANCEPGNQYDDIVTLGDEMYAIHYADNLGNADTHLLAFCGSMDPSPIIRALQEIEFDGYFTLECDGPSRTDGIWSGPDLQGAQNLQALSRLEQERLLYDAAQYILNEESYRVPPSPEDLQTSALNVLASENSWTKHHHGDVKSVDATDTIIKVGGTTYGSEFTGFMLTKVAIDELAQQFDTMSFKIEFSSDTEAIPKYVDIYSTQKGDFISGWTLEADNDVDYYFENGATVTIDLKTLSTISTQEVALKFVFTGEGASAWTPFGADAYVTFSNITFSNNE